jgi:hypothetical protein
MTVLVVGMLVALVIAGVVVALVAVPAARDGRQVLSPEGEQIVQAAREATVDAVVTVKDKAFDLADRIPVVPSRSDAAPAGADIDLRETSEPPSKHRT